MRLAGYAALFDVPDAAKDTIRRGAFAHTLSGRKQPVPLLWQHRANARIGTVETLAEDARGLRVVARLCCGRTASAGSASATARAGSGGRRTGGCSRTLSCSRSAW